MNLRQSIIALLRPLGVATALSAAIFAIPQATAQSVTIVGTQHLRGLHTAPNAQQLNHSVEALLAFRPTQVCVERMSGERLQQMAADPSRNAMALSANTHGRPLGNLIIPMGVEMQARMAILPSDAREEASRTAPLWDQLSLAEKERLIGLQVAGYEFHSAVLNWSYLTQEERSQSASQLLAPVAQALETMLNRGNEVYALAVPLAQRAGLHQLCTADAQENEAAGMQIAAELGGQEIIESSAISTRLERYGEKMNSVWRPDDGAGALTQMLAYMNSAEFAEFDRENQWELLRDADNDSGAFHRRLMFWHARTAQISSELYKALAKGPKERVLLIIGAAHRPFNEAEMRAQPWLTVVPAAQFLGEYQTPE